MLPNSIRVMNSLDPVPRHPVAGGHQGVGTHYFIDKEDGGGPANFIETVEMDALIVADVLHSVKRHLWPSYMQTFKEAAVRFNDPDHA